MKLYAVYRYDFSQQGRKPIGLVLERRKRDRGNNVKGLLNLAKKLYYKSSLESPISISPVLE